MYCWLERLTPFCSCILGVHKQFWIKERISFLFCCFFLRKSMCFFFLSSLLSVLVWRARKMSGILSFCAIYISVYFHHWCVQLKSSQTRRYRSRWEFSCASSFLSFFLLVKSTSQEPPKYLANTIEMGCQLIYTVSVFGKWKEEI